MFRKFRTAGPAVDLLRRIRSHAACRRAKVCVRYPASLRAERVIIAIGQVHPVSRGRFSFFAARKIARCQAWIFALGCALKEEFGVSAFGQEGLSAKADSPVTGRIRPSLIKDLGSVAEDPRSALAFLRSAASRWRRALKDRNDRDIAKAVRELSALTLLQVRYRDAGVFSIEQSSVHARVTSAVHALGIEIEKLERSAAFRRARSKKGKNLTKEEYAATVRRNGLVKKFNAVLRHPERDRSIFREVSEYAKDRDVTVFLLGEAHRTPMLKIAAEFGDDDVLFMWITPPNLRKPSMIVPLTAFFVAILALLTLGPRMPL